jgi:tetratricopeptide (TPR) repeat protein
MASNPPLKPLDLEHLLAALRDAHTPEAWREMIDTYGPAVFKDLGLLIGLQTKTIELDAQDPEAAARLRRWLEDMMNRQNPNRIEEALLGARSDEELADLLQANRALVTRQLGMNALREVRALCAERSPVHPMLRGPLCERILHVTDRIARFLGDELLLAECQFQRSRVAATNGRFDGAIAALADAAEGFRKLGDQFRVAQCLGQIGTFQMHLGAWNDAEQSLMDSLELLGPGDDGLLAPTYEELAQLALRKTDGRAAAGWFTRAGESRLRQNRPEQASFDFQASIPLYLGCGEDDPAYRNALHFFALRSEMDRARTSPELDEEFMEIIARHVAGLAGKALRRADPETRALTGWRDDGGGEGELHADPDFLDKARRWASLGKRGLAMTRDEQAKAFVRLGSALVALNTANFETAAEDADSAARFFEQSEDLTLYVGAIKILAEAEHRRGRLTEAVARLEASMGRVRSLGEPGLVVELLEQQVGLLVSLDEARTGLGLLTEALNLAQHGDDPRSQRTRGSLNASLGALYRYLRQIECAVPPTIEALRIARAIGYRGGEAQEFQSLSTLCGMIWEGLCDDLPIDHRWGLLRAIAAGSLGTPGPKGGGEESTPSGETLQDCARELGRQLLERAIEIYREIGDHRGEAVGLGNLSNFLKADDSEEALETLYRALGQLRHQRGPAQSEAVILANMGKRYLATGRTAEARPCLEHSLRLSESLRDYEWAYDTAKELGMTYVADGMWADAVKYFRLAVDYVDVPRGHLPLEDSARVAFARGKLRAHEQLARLYVQRGRTVDAFDVVQRAKSRALLELSPPGSVTPTVPVTPPLAALLEEEGRLLDEIRLHPNDANTPNTTGTGKRSFRDIQAALDDLYQRLDPLDPQYVATRIGRPTGLRQLRETLARQGRPVLLVEYFFAGEILLIFAMRAEWHAPECLVPDVTEAQVSSWRTEFERQVVRYRGRGPQTWMAVGGAVLDPINDHLREGDLVYVVPHGPLHGLPIHALSSRGGRRLIESHPVAYLPATSLLKLSQLPGKGTNHLRTCGAVGVEFEDEARSVAALFDDGVALTGDLTPEQVAASCGGRDVCHFSCHGHYDAFDPRGSGLVIQRVPPDRPPPACAVLTTAQILRINFLSELVCLSACQSGVGRVVHGDEQIGLLRAFFLAGASSIVSTLWPVEARATRDFMEVFYHHLLGAYRETGRIEKATALQRAQLAIMERHGASGSYYWAPFILSGNWT